MTSPIYWLTFIIAFLALVMLSGVKQADTKTVNICVSIKLPAQGKCVYRKISGYKVRVCK